MRRSLLHLALAFLFVVSALACARAQRPAPPVDLQADRQQITALAGPWRFHPGDNPAWSGSAFDDSSWNAVDPTTEWATPGNTGASEFSWFRIRLLPAPHTDSLLVQMPLISRNYQLFADGKLIAEVGKMPPASATPVSAARRVFTIPIPPSPTPRPVTLALRLWIPAAIATVRSSAFDGPVLVGAPGELLERFSLSKAAALLASGGEYTVDIICLVVGAASFILFLLHRRQVFYLWLACFTVLIAMDLPITLAGRHWGWSFYTSVNLFLLVDFLQVVVSIYLVVDLLNLPRSRGIPATICALLAEVGILLVTFGHLPSVYADVIYFLFGTASGVIVIVILVRAALAGSTDARLLLVPYVVSAIPSICDNLSHTLADFNVPHAEVLGLNTVAIIHSPFTVYAEQVSEVASVLGLLGVLIYHFARTTHDHQRLTSALAAAHEIQYQLVPADIPSFGGLSTEVAYIAAEEVGGDFCQVLPRPDGSMLIAIGDVSGKGLRAAMLGTLCVGALRSMAEEPIGPAEALSRVNRAILRSENSGFVTCLCALLSPTGAITLANAGHLAPYINGVELPLDCGLPLGIVDSAEYAERTVQLPDSARITLLSDGVVEARSPSGELFGFDRTSSISAHPASQIAADAQDYGPQHDDITVLTLDWKAPALTPKYA